MLTTKVNRNNKIDRSVLFVSTTDFGGAGLAALRTFMAMRPLLTESELLLSKSSFLRTPKVVSMREGQKILNRVLNYVQSRLISRSYPKNADIFNHGLIGVDISDLCDKYDIVQLFWVCNLISIGCLKKIRRPVVWRFSDLWPITYGFHYDQKLIEIGDWKYYRMSLPGYLRRIVDWKLGSVPKDITIVCPSQWMRRLVLSSGQFPPERVVNIPTGVDSSLFAPIRKETARLVLNINSDSIVLLVGAQAGDMDSRKGFDRVREILKLIREMNKKIFVIGFGRQSYEDSEIRWFGHVNSERIISILFSASDLYIHGAIHDNFPQIILEAQSCGTPVAAFDSTGVAEAVLHGITGLKLSPTDTNAQLAERIYTFLDRDSIIVNASTCAREHVVKNYALSSYTDKMIDLYLSVGRDKL
jgi:glycosyltransferase involved in cell wall biosynthesis